MKITKVRASYGRTLNLGNFENVRLDASVEADLSPGDEFNSVYEALMKAARIAVSRQEKQAQRRLLATAD